MSEQDKPVAGKAVEKATGAVEQVASQVESAAVEATEFASDEVLGRGIGYLRALKQIAEAIATGAIDTASGAGDVLLRELDETREKVESALKGAAGGK